MKTKILLSFCCLFSIASFAQDSIFQLKDYKYRTEGYRALEFTASLNGSNVNFKQSGAEETKDNYFQLYPSWINYRKVFSSDKRWHTSYISFSPSLLSHTEGTDQLKAKGKNAKASVDWQLDDRFYKSNNWFFQLGNHLYAKEDFTKQLFSQSKTRTNVSGVDETLVIGFGKGRIEMVEDAQMALFILNDLQEQGLLSTMPDAATINQFAQLITAINNRRIFDSRKRRIYQLTQIESFLREKDITPVTDIRHFTIIDDNWTLAFNPSRLSGSDWYLTINSSAEMGSADQKIEEAFSKTINKNNSMNLGIGPKLGYENYKPVNLKWQRNMGAWLSWQIEKAKQNDKHTISGSTTENKTKSKQTETECYAFYGFGFYPNNRTRLNAELNVRASQLRFFDNLLKKQISVSPQISFSTDYFISYKTRLNASVYLGYNYDRYSYTSLPSAASRSFNGNFSVGISHSFL